MWPIQILKCMGTIEKYFPKENITSQMAIAGLFSPYPYLLLLLFDR